MQLPLLAVALSALMSVPSTTAERFRVTDAETLLRFLPEEDCMLVMDIERGIVPDEEEKEVDDPPTVSLRALASGRRVFPATGGLMNLDLDSLPTVEEPGEKLLK